MRFLSKIKKLLSTIGHYIGLFWTKIILGIFFLTVFAVAACFVKLLSDPLQRKKRKSLWQTWTHAGTKEDWFHPF